MADARRLAGRTAANAMKHIPSNITLPLGATAPRRPGMHRCTAVRAATPAEAVALDVEYVHYQTDNGQGSQLAAAHVCVVDRRLHVLYKSYINPGLPPGARPAGGVRLALVNKAPGIAQVSCRQSKGRAPPGLLHTAPPPQAVA